jgi:hypothetical protein
MPRKGRDLEKLVVLFEENLGPKGISVKSPDYIEGQKSKSKREVDISLRSTIGSSDILIIVECRDRKGTEDVTWIEQLSQKRIDVGAHKALAVSSTGFSSGAINVANNNEGIELRTLKEVAPDEVLSWFNFKHIDILKKRVRFKDIELLIDHVKNETLDFPSDIYSNLYPSLKIGEKIFHSKRDKNPLSVMDIWSRANEKNNFYSKIKPGAPPTEISIILEFPADKCIQILTNRGYKDIKYMKLKVDLWIEFERLPVNVGHVYKSIHKSGDKTIAKKAICEFEYIGHQFSIDLYKIPRAGKEFMKIRLKGKDRNQEA